MIALSIQQPWAWLIVHGYKPIENRTWATKVHGRVLIHAGLKVDRVVWSRLKYYVPELPTIANLECGGIVGEATLTNCVTEHSSLWFEGPFGFVFIDPRPLPFMACKGRLGFFEVDYINPKEAHDPARTTAE